MQMDVDQTLSLLARTFTVRDIMVPVDDLRRVEDTDEARARFADPAWRYDTLPTPATGAITGYITRDSVKFRRIAPPILVSDGTGILDVLDIVQSQQPFCFVLSGGTICGFMHYSDFNHPLVKLPFFVLMERVEVTVWALIEPLLPDALQPRMVGDKRYQDIQQRLKENQENNVDREYKGILYLNEMLTIARENKVIILTGEEQQAIAATRNRVFHADRQLVDKLDNLTTMKLARNACQKIVAASAPLEAGA